MIPGSIQEQAQAYVESLDFISDEARNIAGNAYMTGAKWAFEMAANHAENASGLTTSLEDKAEQTDGWNRACKAIGLRIRAWLF